MMNQHLYSVRIIIKTRDLKDIQVMIIQHQLLSSVFAHRFHLSIERGERGGTKLCDRSL